MSATISPELADLIRRWHAIEADHRRKLAEAHRQFDAAGFDAINEATMAITGPASDAERAVAMEIATFPAQSLTDIAAKCAFATTEGRDEDFEVAVATAEATAADAERLAGKGGAA
jgi:hypothetical protein